MPRTAAFGLARSLPTVRSGPPAWLAALVACGGLTGVYFALPQGGAQTAATAAVGLVAAGVIALAARRMERAARLPWFVLAAFQATFAAGDAVFPTVQGSGNDLLGSALLADTAYLVGYALGALGLILLVRRRVAAREVGGIIDSLVLAVAVGTLLWVMVIAPEAYHGTSAIDRVFAVAYPVLDLVLGGLVVRMLLSGGRASGSLRLMGLAVLALLLADIGLALARVEQSFVSGGLSDAGWLLAYGLFAAAALHPSAELTHKVASLDAGRLTGRRRGLLLAACLSPALALLGSLDHDISHELPALAVGGAVIAALLVWRFSAYASLQESTAFGERSLRYAATELAGAGEVEAVAAATLGGAIGLIPGANEIRINLLTGSTFTIAAAAGQGADDFEGFTAEFDQLALPVQNALLSHRADDLAVDDSMRPLVRVHTTTCFLGLYPLLGEDESLAGWIVVGTERPVSLAVRESLYHLTSLASLALERAQLSAADSRSSAANWVASIVDGSWDVITIVEPEGIVRWMSDSVGRTLGYAADTLAGTRLGDLLHPDDPPELHDLLSGDWEPLPDVPVRARMLAASGVYHSVELVLNDLRADEAVRGVVVTARDITEQTVLERLALGAAWAQLRAN